MNEECKNVITWTNYWAILIAFDLAECEEKKSFKPSQAFPKLSAR
jgi:hypothetical protein